MSGFHCTCSSSPVGQNLRSQQSTSKRGWPATEKQAYACACTHVYTGLLSHIHHTSVRVQRLLVLVNDTGQSISAYPGLFECSTQRPKHASRDCPPSAALQASRSIPTQIPSASSPQLLQKLLSWRDATALTLWTENSGERVQE